MDVKQIKHESSPNRDWDEGIRSRSSSNGSTVSGGANNCLAMPGANQSMNVQLLTEYLEWIQTVPELKMFSEQDKVSSKSANGLTFSKSFRICSS